MSVNDIIASFDASPATLRKDLAFLEESGIIRRSHGEAHFITGNTLPPNELRQSSNIEEKRLIARKAMSFIKDGDTIVLDSGTTTLELARLIEKSFTERLTVVTHSVEITHTLGSCPVNITTVMSGGVLSCRTLSLIGPEVERFFRGLEVDLAFITASGVKKDGTLTCYLPFEPSIKQTIINSAKSVIAVIDSSKFSKTCVTGFADMDSVDYLITDAGFEQTGMRSVAEGRGTNIIIAE